MRTRLWLAAPVACLALLAGCCGTDACGPVADDCDTCVATTVAVVDDCAVCELPPPSCECEGGYVSAGYAVAEAAPVAIARETFAAAPAPAAEAVVVAEASGDTLTAEEYMALIKAGKVTDPDYRLPGSAASVESVEVAASIPARFQAWEEEDVEAVVSAEVEEMSVAAREIPVTSDELTTPALMNAAALREAAAVTATVVAVQTESVQQAVPHIPSMPLPEGWNYVNEQDLGAASRFNAEVDQDDQYFSSAGRTATGEDI